MNRFEETIKSYGYDEIQTPTLEFLNVFLEDEDYLYQTKTFRFIDRDGETLVLRPDYTPSVARCAVKYFSDENIPIRFFYKGNAFSNKGLYEGKAIEVTQMGIELLKDDTLTPMQRQTLIKQASDVTNKLLLSIVEEPEQNQYPTSQREVLYKLIDLHNGENDQLVITTHSPYIINYLALAIKAYDIARRCPAATAELDKVVPQASMIDGAKVAVYQVHEDGTISLLPKYDEMPSDDNLLNNLLEESNEQFNQLLDIEEECHITK